MVKEIKILNQDPEVQEALKRETIERANLNAEKSASDAEELNKKIIEKQRAERLANTPINKIRNSAINAAQAIRPNIPALIQQTVPVQPIGKAAITEGPGASPQYYAVSEATGGNYANAVQNTMPTLKALGGLRERG